MINYLPFMKNKEPEVKQGKLDMMDTQKSDFDSEMGGESASLINKTVTEPKTEEKKGFVANKLDQMAETIQKKVESKTGDLTKPNYVWMAIFFAIGCLFLLAAFTSLPFILISPAGFNMYFSLASTSMLISVSFYYGPINYLKTLFDRKNIMISMLFIGSTLASLFTIFSKAGYLWSIGLVIL